MNRLISVLLSVLFIQLLIVCYVQFIYKEELPTLKNLPLSQEQTIELNILVNNSIEEILKAAKELPQSDQYTTWDNEMLAKISREIQQPIAPKEKVYTSNKKVPKKISTTLKVEKYAKEKLGKQYVWGATGPNKFDCSGFTKEVFRCTAGINIPRVSRDQAKVGKYIKYKDLKRGDMVFFDTEKKFTKKVNHVGIYLSNNNFIHASSAKKKVIITNFNKKPFYKKRFLWGRRVVKNKS